MTILTRIVLAATLFWPAARPLRAEGFVKRFIDDEYHIWTSPFRTGNYDSHTMKKYGLPFLGITAATIASDRKTAELLPNTLDQAVWSGRVSQAGAAYTLAGFCGVGFVIGKAFGNDHFAEANALGLEALAHTQIVVFGVKQATRRQRPLVANHRGGFWKGGDSFPSGHAASAFALATVYAYEYRQHLAVPIAAYSGATLIAISRISARRHWVSDIFVGSSAGFLIGRFMYKRHHDTALPGSPVQQKSRLMPHLGFGPMGPALLWNF